jgi:two-component system chemotaxis response regulator CheB
MAQRSLLRDHHPTGPPATQLIVIGASAGGLQPLRMIVEALPTELDAAVLVVVHVSSTGTSVLPQILDRGSDLDVAAATDGAELRPGGVFVARPDRHILVERGHIRCTRDPRENGHRPAIDPLFRSAAGAYGQACCGVILSGTRDDGTAGLAEIKRRGGIALVQDPDEAEYSAMPSNARAGADVDAVLPAAAIAPELVRLAGAHAEIPEDEQEVPG